MVGKKFLNLVVIMLLVGSLLIGCTASPTPLEAEESNTASKQQDDIIKIGITQLVEHPALDASRQGFIAALEENGYISGENFEIEYQNAQNDIPTAQTIASNFVADKKDMILAIATPSAQAAYNATKDIPILITAVTDPIEAGLVKSWEKTGTNIAGTSDMNPVKEQFKLLNQLIPTAKKVGVLYNTSEVNSEIQVNKIENLAPNFDLEIKKAGVTSVNEISQALQELLNEVDVMYVPTDNLVVSAIPLIVNESIDKNIPIIAAEEGHVKAGALATEGIEYYKLGFQTGLMAIDIINGEKPENMSVDTLKDTQIIINEDTAEKLGVHIPEELKKSAEIIKGGE